MSKKIFLVGDDETLKPMVETPYEREDVLQELLERYPDILAGDEISGSSPRRWLLVKREMRVPDSCDTSGRWSLDHLFLDQDGILTLVEVKRATDSRARREVVAQMLDYAANAVLYWPIETIISSFEQTTRDSKRDPAEVLTAFLSGGGPSQQILTAEEFWTRVKTSLAAEQIRMVFVADSIPRELQRIVEFLNDQMDPAEVLAVEVKQYVGERLRTVVPHVVGQSVKSVSKSSPTRESYEWDRESFLQNARELGGDQVVEIAARLMDWFDQHGCEIGFGSGKSATFAVRERINGAPTTIATIFSNGGLQLALERIPLTEARQELRARLTAIKNAELSAAKAYPTMTISPLVGPEEWRQFVDAFESLLASLRGSKI